MVLESDLGMPLRSLVVADLIMLRGVPTRFGFDGDLVKVGICVAGFLVLAARANEAWVGVEIAASMLDCDREMEGVDGKGLLSWLEAGRAVEISSVTCFRARLAGAVFSNRSERTSFSLLCSTFLEISSLSSNCAFDCVRLRLFVTGVKRPG